MLCLPFNCLSLARTDITSPFDLSLPLQPLTSGSPSFPIHTHLQKVVRARANFRQAALRTGLRHCNRSSQISSICVCPTWEFLVFGNDSNEFVSRWEPPKLKSRIASKRTKKKEKKKKNRKKMERITDRFERTFRRARTLECYWPSFLDRFTRMLDISLPLAPPRRLTRCDADVSAVISLHPQK